MIAEDIQFTERTTPMRGCGALCIRLADEEDGSLAQAIWTADQKGSKVVLSTTEVGKNGTTNVLGGDARLVGARRSQRQLHGRRRQRHSPLPLHGTTAQEVPGRGGRAAHRARDSARPRSRGRARGSTSSDRPATVRSYSYSHVLGKVPAAAFRGKIVVIGASRPVAAGRPRHRLRRREDVGSGGPGERRSRPRCTASRSAARGLAELRPDRPLRAAPAAREPPLLRRSALARAGTRSASCSRSRSQLAFNHGHVVVVHVPASRSRCRRSACSSAEYLLEAFERARTHDTFSRFVPEAVVNQVLARTGGELRLGGERVEGTVMFTDLAASPPSPRGSPPNEVIGLLNGYLGEISDAVLAHGGTLVSYLGDGLMAVFGAPLPQDDHADRALAAAREMLEVRLPQFNEMLREQGFGAASRWASGSTAATFMSGNVGSQRRLEYTAIGDTINTASRIEGMTKDAATSLSRRLDGEALPSRSTDLVYVGAVPSAAARQGRAVVVRGGAQAGTLAPPAAGVTALDAYARRRATGG